MYGVLYAISPEIFPAKDRGTGHGLVFTAARIFGLIVRFEKPFFFKKNNNLTLIEYLGSNYCVVCQLIDRCSCLYFRRSDLSSRWFGVVDSL